MMGEEYLQTMDPRRRHAVQELTSLIVRRYPTATISVGPGEEDPGVTHITAMVDLDDPDEVADLVMDRMLELHLEEGIPVYVIPVRTPARVAALRRRKHSHIPEDLLLAVH